MSDTATLRIGELATLADVSTRTIRHYHRIGLLPEPQRAANGYRVYGLRDLILLLRARRLAELGMPLGEVADALGDDRGRDLQEILAELDADLERQQESISRRRRRIEAIRQAERHRDRDDVLADLARVAGEDHPGLERERRIAELLEGSLDPEAASQVWDVYRDVLHDEELSASMLALSARFEQLHGLDPTDPRVDEIAEGAGDLGGIMRSLMPDDSVDAGGDPQRFLQAVEVDLYPAQRRCLRLMVARWTEQEP